MIIIDPWDDQGWDLAAHALAGGNLVSARYFGSRAAEACFTSYSDFDLVLKGVELATSSKTMAIMWQMEGVKKGIGFAVDPDDDFYADEELAIVDVSHTSHWRSLLDLKMVAVALASHLPDENSPTCTWSFRVSFEGGKAVTVALGELAEGNTGFTYQPDNVAVIFVSSIARTYRIPASANSAWGSVVA